MSAPTSTVQGVAAWHTVFEANDEEELLRRLDGVLAEQVVFHSPLMFRPVEGKIGAAMYLRAAGQMLVNEHWRYVRELVDGQDAVLEFSTEVEGVLVNGVDMLRFNDEGKIVDFKVMLRPNKAIETVKAYMARQMG
ncbi:MAG: nuclear transport factor 2 family protein [Myxococcota bacterium]